MRSTTTRTVRFTSDEIRDIEAFLNKNPFFDFSSLARIALAEFVRNPKLQVMAIQAKPAARKMNKGKGEINV